MHEYYFKIRKGDIEFECSTTDKITFEQQLSDWINGVVKGAYVAAPKPAINDNISNDSEQQPQRSGFIDVKNLTSINEIQTPDIASSFGDFDLGKEPKDDLPSAQINFEDALNESLENPKTEVIEKTDGLSDFEEYIKQYNPESQTDYLIVTSMYILNIENKERFSIKQLNAKLVPLTGKPIDHSMIQEAMDQNYVRIIPDLTGTSEFTEYTLTEQGEGYFVV